MNRSRTKDDTVSTSGLDGASRDRDEEESESRWHRTLSLAFTVAVIAFTIYLWPAMLGGNTRLIIVSGHSMEPTYELRDIVVARDAGNTEVGDVVVFEVPEGRAEGILVIHRVLEVDDEGFFITQGDNRTTPDQWQLTEGDIVGKPLVHIPKGGKVLGFIQNIWVIALLVGLVTLFMLWPDTDEEADDEEEEEEERLAALVTSVTSPEKVLVASRVLDDTDALDRDDVWIAARIARVAESDLVRSDATDQHATSEELAQRWLETELGPNVDAEIDDDVMADALAWLDQQLAGFEQSAAH